MLVPIFSTGLLDYLIRDPKNREGLNYVNMWVHLEEFARGVVDSRRIVYYLSATAFFLFAVVAAISPGPSNLILTSTGAAFGVRRGLPALVGVATGTKLMTSKPP